jgi:hypothetical protein
MWDIGAFMEEQREQRSLEIGGLFATLTALPLKPRLLLPMSSDLSGNPS